MGNDCLQRCVHVVLNAGKSESPFSCRDKLFSDYYFSSGKIPLWKRCGGGGRGSTSPSYIFTFCFLLSFGASSLHSPSGEKRTL